MRLTRFRVGGMLLGLVLAAGAPAASAGPPPSTVEVRPGQSVAAAVARVAPGGTVVVHAGSYPALQLGPRAWATPVTIRSVGAVSYPAVSVRRVSRLRLVGARVTGLLTIDGGSDVHVSSSSLSGVTIKDGASDVELRGNAIVGGWNGVGVSSWKRAVPPRRVRIIGNRISGQANDNIQIGIAHDVTIEGNDITDPVMNANHNDGIQVMGGERLLVRGNRISGQDQAILLQPEAVLGAGTVVADARIEGNTIGRTRGAGIIVSSTLRTTVSGNTIRDTPLASVHLIGANRELRVVGNVLRQVVRQRGASAPIENHIP